MKEILPGQRFGQLVVLAEAPRRRFPSGGTSAQFLCRCDCGKEVEVLRYNLVGGNSKTCGCSRYRHGHARKARSKEYRAWSAMMHRCGNPANPHWASYGGRGIKVCSRWHDFALFLKDMGPAPDGHRISLDRIDVDGPYSPENCRWATPRQQANNRTNNRRVMYEGEWLTIAEASRRAAIDRGTLWDRVVRKQWPAERWFDPVR
jgi:hypothetical protein